MTGREGEKGMALLLVLVVVALLTSLLAELAFSTLVDLRLTETFRDSTRAYYLAKGGVSAGRMILQADKNAYDGLDEVWSKGVASYPVGEGSVSVRIEDQDGRLAINGMVDGDNPQTAVIDRFYRLLVALDVDTREGPAELTAALVDWLDAGSEPYAEIRTDGQRIPVAGAEEIYYQGLTPAYHCANRPLETLQELALVKGFTPELVAKLAPHLTVSPVGAINVNTASAEVLMSLDPVIDRDAAQAVVESRRAAPITNVAALETLLSSQQYAALKSLANLDQLGTTSRSYRIDSTALVNDGRRRVVADVDKTGNRLLFFKVNE